MQLLYNKHNAIDMYNIIVILYSEYTLCTQVETQPAKQDDQRRETCEVEVPDPAECEYLVAPSWLRGESVRMCICTCIYEYMHVYVPSDFLTMLCKFWLKPCLVMVPLNFLQTEYLRK